MNPVKICEFLFLSAGSKMSVKFVANNEYVEKLSQHVQYSLYKGNNINIIITMNMVLILYYD